MSLSSENQSLNEHSAPSITLTKAAKAQVCRSLEAGNNLNTKLRIYIIGGGCSGFQYGFKLDNNENADDIIIELPSESEKYPIIKVIIDALSFQYLSGSEIDYVLNLQGARYVVKNPNAETTCGCGSSFSLKEE